MGRSLPQEWIDGTLHTLNVVRHLGGKGNISHTSLSVVRQKPSANSRKTKNLQWRFLPEKADDPRPFAGKTNRGRGKRIYIDWTCGTTDPWEAAKVAVAVSQKKWQDLLSQSQVREVERSTRSVGLLGQLVCQGGTGTAEQPKSLVERQAEPLERNHRHEFNPRQRSKASKRLPATTFWSSFVLLRRTVKRRATQEKRPEGNTRPLSATCSKRRKQISLLCLALSSLPSRRVCGKNGTSLIRSGSN